jgi:hypothetical protein
MWVKIVQAANGNANLDGCIVFLQILAAVLGDCFLVWFIIQAIQHA